MNLMIIFVITCILFLCSVISLIQMRSCSISDPTPTPHHPSNKKEGCLFLSIAIMILSGVLVILIGYMIQTKQVEIPSQFMGSDTCEEPTCGDGPVLGSMYGISAFDDTEYDI